MNGNEPEYPLMACRPIQDRQLSPFRELYAQGIRLLHVDATFSEDIFHPELRAWKGPDHFDYSCQEDYWEKFSGNAPRRACVCAFMRHHRPGGTKRIRSNCRNMAMVRWRRIFSEPLDEHSRAWPRRNGVTPHAWRWRDFCAGWNPAAGRSGFGDCSCAMELHGSGGFWEQIDFLIIRNRWSADFAAGSSKLMVRGMRCAAPGGIRM